MRMWVSIRRINSSLGGCNLWRAKSRDDQEKVEGAHEDGTSHVETGCTKVQTRYTYTYIQRALEFGALCLSG